MISKLNIRKNAQTGATCDDALPSFLFPQVCHEIIGPSYLEAKDFLKIFSLKPNFIA
jgi:hypothetical protein